jgi:alkylation response protein AidB-like acyl-CoA dehydrogenase
VPGRRHDTHLPTDDPKVQAVNFSLTDDQELLRGTARQLLADHCPTTLLRAHADDIAAADGLWARVRDFVPLGLGPVVDLCVFAEELGFVAAPTPFLATACLYAPLLEATGDHDLDAVLDGHASGTVALAGADGAWHPNAEPEKTFVPDAAGVDLVAAVGASGAVTLLASPPARRIDTLDTTRCLYLVETAVPGTAAGTVGRAALDTLLARATVALAAEMVGTARRLFTMTLTYAKERVQFDVPIGSFQAVQHKLADMSLDVERATSAVYYAAMALDASDDDAPRAVHVAKAAAGEAAKRAAKDGIQIHGGIGYTAEHDLHLFIRRAYGAEALLGTTAWHHDRLADLLL